MNTYKKKDCYNCMRSLTDEASESDVDAKKVRTTREPKHFIRINENRS
jgi:hypothetical protein